MSSDDVMAGSIAGCTVTSRLSPWPLLGVLVFSLLRADVKCCGQVSRVLAFTGQRTGS
jgi:hypothetical protein